MPDNRNTAPHPVAREILPDAAQRYLDTEFDAPTGFFVGTADTRHGAGRQVEDVVRPSSRHGHGRRGS